jgi:hypothetical protein
MVMQQQDVARARNAAAQLTQAVEALRRQAGDTVDVRRLRQDVQRASEDLELLVGPAVAPAPAPTLEVIPDRDYPPDFWGDAQDEGLGRH